MDADLVRIRLLGYQIRCVAVDEIGHHIRAFFDHAAAPAIVLAFVGYDFKPLREFAER
ncbi:hypothetical protein ACLMAL_27835 [Nocardia sp. CWNU-33]|uniref:hypothetical protein n=1 Tax=Nocardia sp. CWNU-33 TaxID=3392117 RepID=UPI00398EC23D